MTQQTLERVRAAMQTYNDANGRISGYDALEDIARILDNDAPAPIAPAWPDWQFERFTITMPLDTALECSVGGRSAESYVDAALARADIAAQFDTIDAGAIVQELLETGGWEEHELTDPALNRARIFWIAAGNIREDQPEPDGAPIWNGSPIPPGSVIVCPGFHFDGHDDDGKPCTFFNKVFSVLEFANVHAYLEKVG